MFVAVHRGGPLTKENHRLLIKWAYACSVHVLPLCKNDIDSRLASALAIALEWEQGNASVGDARKASVSAIAVANGLSDPVSIAVARSVGHTVATAHMADHSIGAAYYALKATKRAGKSVDEERKWQEEQLPQSIRELVISAREARPILRDGGE